MSTASAAAVALAWLAAFLGSTAFAPFFADVHPALATAAVAIAGLLAMRGLAALDWFDAKANAAAPHSHLKGPITWAAIATAFAIAMAAADIAAVLPPDLNVLLPESALFYAAMAVVAEIVFHLVPLTIAFAALRGLLGRTRRRTSAWIAIIVVASLEPLFQVIAGFSGATPAWFDPFMVIHLYLFNLVGLALFWRHGFGAMLSLRLFYYLHWHILWGTLRLDILF